MTDCNAKLWYAATLLPAKAHLDELACKLNGRLQEASQIALV